MARTKKYIVLDVEGQSSCRPYNVGYIITDSTNTIYESVSVALPETMTENLQKCWASQEMTHKNICEILDDYANPPEKWKYKYMTIDNFYSMFCNHIKQYNISEIWAYNVSFDKNSLKRLFGEIRFFAIKDNKNNMVKWCDIWSCITHSLLLTKKYINWCEENNKVTEKGYFSTSAQTVYQYITGNMEFDEEHTGLADVLIENEILNVAKRQGKKLHKECSLPWKILHNFHKGKDKGI